MQESLKWLNDWEKAKINGDIQENEFLTSVTACGLRLSINSTMDLCKYMNDKYGFKYLLTGKVNQENLEVVLYIS